MAINLTLEVDEINNILVLLAQNANQVQQLVKQAQFAKSLYDKVHEQALNQPNKSNTNDTP